MKLYLAHNFAAQSWLREVVVPALEAKGYEITSRWLKDMGHGEGGLAIEARVDLDDIVGSDALVLFVDNFGSRPGKGKYVELGYALALGREIVLVGEDDGCVFYHLDSNKIRRIASWKEL